jgi:hypothetical protein
MLNFTLDLPFVKCEIDNAAIIASTQAAAESSAALLTGQLLVLLLYTLRFSAGIEEGPLVLIEVP